MTKRIGLGLLTTLLIAIAFDLIASMVPASWTDERLAGYFSVWPGVGAAVVGFFAALGGAYVARVLFVIPVVLFAIGTGRS